MSRDRETEIAPSVLSADFARLAEHVGAARLLVDMSDGHFIPPDSFSPLVIEKPHRRLPIEVHMMVEDPERHLERLHGAGTNRLSVHQEVCPRLHLLVAQSQELGMDTGVAVDS